MLRYIQEDLVMKRGLSIILALLVLIIPLSVRAVPGKVELPPFKETILKNGLKVFVMETVEVPMLTIRLLIPAGSMHDVPGREGVAGLTAGLIAKGAAGMSAEEISETVEGVGGSLEAYADRDYTIVAGSFMARDFRLGLDILGRVVLSPDFPGDEVEREISIKEAGLQGIKEQPSSLASREFISRLIGDHPYAHPVDGTLESIAAISRDDLVGFHRARYVPDGSILAIVGDVSTEKALKSIRKVLGKWGGRAAADHGIERLEPRIFPGTRVVVIDKPDVTQSQIRIGNIAVKRNTPDYFPLLVANNILGGGFTSRLMDEIRVNRGLSYGARSNLFRRLHGGVFGVYTFTKNATLRETIDVATAEIERIRTVTVGEDELESSKKYLSGLFPFELETNDNLARWLTEIEFYGFDPEFVEDYRERIDGVTADDIRRVVTKHFHVKDCFILLLTNYEEVSGQLEGLGNVEVIGIDDIR